MQTLKPYRFDAAERRWRIATPAADCARSRLHVVTFNVWFGDPWMEERCVALLDILNRLRPDLIALQEVTPRFLARALDVEWIRREYWVSDATGATGHRAPENCRWISRTTASSFQDGSVASPRTAKLRCEISRVGTSLRKNGGGHSRRYGWRLRTFCRVSQR